MKRTFIYLAAALAFVSCSQNEITEGATTPVNSDVIGFSSSISGTRAAENDNTIVNLKADGFEVVGLNKDDGRLFDKSDGMTVDNSYQFKDDKWGWTKETDNKKWPAAEEYPLTFFGYYPSFADIGSFWDDNFIWGGATFVDPTDLLQNQDHLAAHSVVTTKPASGMAPLSFKHILSKIQFQIVSPVGYKIYIQSLTIRNVATGDRLYDYTKELNAAYTPEPVGGYSPINIVDYVHMMDATFHKAVEITGAGFSDPTAQGVRVPSGDGTGTETWKLMPQKNVPVWDKDAFAAFVKTTASREWTADEWLAFLANDPTVFDGSYIELTYRMEDAGGKSIVGRKSGEMINGTASSSNKYVTVAFPLNIATVNGGLGWEPNKQYTYQIKLGTPDASNGTVIDPNYKNENGTTSDDYIDNPETQPGEDITDKDGYIGFDVIVDEWADGGNTGIQ